MKLHPRTALLLLAPAIGEVTCGSTPPVKLVDIGGVLLNVVLYGGGALLIREAVVRSRKGWLTLLILGAAYGIVEEGLLCKSFFDPHFPGIDQLGVYGRAFGVNWVWAFFLTVYHAVYSIGFSVLLVETLYPDRVKESWVSNRGAVVTAILLVGDVLFGYFLFPDAKAPYRLSGGLTVAALAAVLALVALAWSVPRPRSRVVRSPAPRGLFVSAMVVPLTFFVFMFASSHSRLPAPAYIGLAAGVFGGAAALVWLYGGSGEWPQQIRLRFVAGVLIGMVPTAVLADAIRHFQSGMLLVGAVELVVAALLLRRAQGGLPVAAPA